MIQVTLNAARESRKGHTSERVQHTSAEWFAILVNNLKVLNGGYTAYVASNTIFKQLQFNLTNSVTKVVSSSSFIFIFNVHI